MRLLLGLPVLLTQRQCPQEQKQGLLVVLLLLQQQLLRL
jgi:hypothetical protein